MNKVLLIGWLAEQPKTEIDTNGAFRCTVNIAVNRSGNVPDVVTLVAFGKNAERVADFNRGDQIGITGSIKTHVHKVQVEKCVIETEVLVESVDLSRKQKSPLDDEFLPEILSCSSTV